MTTKHLFIIFLAIMIVLLLAGCAATSNPSVNVLNAEGKTAGFWLGLWHGVISPVTFIISLFSKNVNIYDVYNNGGWYNFGFIFGVAIIFAGSGRGAGYSAKKRPLKNEIKQP